MEEENANLGTGLNDGPKLSNHIPENIVLNISMSLSCCILEGEVIRKMFNGIFNGKLEAFCHTEIYD